MNQILLIFSILYILFIIYIHYVYNYEKKPQNTYPIWRDELEIEPVLGAYLINKEYEWDNFILADVLTLVDEGYIRNGENRR